MKPPRYNEPLSLWIVRSERSQRIPQPHPGRARCRGRRPDLPRTTNPWRPSGGWPPGRGPEVITNHHHLAAALMELAETNPARACAHGSRPGSER